MRRALAGLILLLVLVLVALTAWEPMTAQRFDPPPSAHYDGRIIRDEWGVPHIYGKRDVDVGFALAYAHAEDDFSTLQEVLAMVRGRARHGRPALRRVTAADPRVAGRLCQRPQRLCREPSG